MKDYTVKEFMDLDVSDETKALIAEYPSDSYVFRDKEDKQKLIVISKEDYENGYR